MSAHDNDRRARDRQQQELRDYIARESQKLDETRALAGLESAEAHRRRIRQFVEAADRRSRETMDLLREGTDRRLRRWEGD